MASVEVRSCFSRLEKFTSFLASRDEFIKSLTPPPLEPMSISGQNVAPSSPCSRLSNPMRCSSSKWSSMNVSRTGCLRGLPLALRSFLVAGELLPEDPGDFRGLPGPRRFDFPLLGGESLSSKMSKGISFPNVAEKTGEDFCFEAEDLPPDLDLVVAFLFVFVGVFRFVDADIAGDFTIVLVRPRIF